MRGRIGTEEGNAGWVGKMKRLSVFSKVLCALHEFSHLFENSQGSRWDLIPRAFQPMNWCCAEGRNYGGQSGIVVKRPTFLE